MPELEKATVSIGTAAAVCVFLVFQTTAIVWFGATLDRRVALIEHQHEVGSTRAESDGDRLDANERAWIKIEERLTYLTATVNRLEVLVERLVPREAEEDHAP